MSILEERSTAQGTTAIAELVASSAFMSPTARARHVSANELEARTFLSNPAERDLPTELVICASSHVPEISHDTAQEWLATGRATMVSFLENTLLDTRSTTLYVHKTPQKKAGYGVRDMKRKKSAADGEGVDTSLGVGVGAWFPVKGSWMSVPQRVDTPHSITHLQCPRDVQQTTRGISIGAILFALAPVPASPVVTSRWPPSADDWFINADGRASAVASSQLAGMTLPLRLGAIQRLDAVQYKYDLLKTHWPFIRKHLLPHQENLTLTSAAGMRIIAGHEWAPLVPACPFIARGTFLATTSTMSTKQIASMPSLDGILVSRQGGWIRDEAVGFKTLTRGVLSYKVVSGRVIETPVALLRGSAFDVADLVGYSWAWPTHPDPFDTVNRYYPVFVNAAQTALADFAESPGAHVDANRVVWMSLAKKTALQRSKGFSSGAAAASTAAVRTEIQNVLGLNPLSSNDVDFSTNVAVCVEKKDRKRARTDTKTTGQRDKSPTTQSRTDKKMAFTSPLTRGLAALL